MANEVLVKQNNGFIFYVSGSFSPADTGTSWNYGSLTGVVLTLASVASAAGRQSDKCDLGATRAERYALFGCIEPTSAPTSGGSVDYYWAPSTSGTQGDANVFGNSGADAAAPGGALGSITLDEFLRLCIPIGRLIVTDDNVVQSGFVGHLEPPSRYGQLIVVNNTSVSFINDNVEMHQVLVPIVREVQ